MNYAGRVETNEWSWYSRQAMIAQLKQKQEGENRKPNARTMSVGSILTNGNEEYVRRRGASQTNALDVHRIQFSRCLKSESAVRVEREDKSTKC